MKTHLKLSSPKKVRATKNDAEALCEGEKVALELEDLLDVDRLRISDETWLGQGCAGDFISRNDRMYIPADEKKED